MIKVSVDDHATLKITLLILIMARLDGHIVSSVGFRMIRDIFVEQTNIQSNQ